jgi:hypothetical protein
MLLALELLDPLLEPLDVPDRLLKDRDLVPLHTPVPIRIHSAINDDGDDNRIDTDIDIGIGKTEHDRSHTIAYVDG